MESFEVSPDAERHGGFQILQGSASALARIDPGLLAKIDPLPYSSVLLPRLQDSLLRWIWRAPKYARTCSPAGLLVQTKSLPRSWWMKRSPPRTPSAWMMLDLVLALRQVAFLAWVIFRERKWVILR